MPHAGQMVTRHPYVKGAEAARGYIARLRNMGWRGYARAYVKYKEGRGSIPDYLDFDMDINDAERIQSRIDMYFAEG